MTIFQHKENKKKYKIYYWYNSFPYLCRDMTYRLVATDLTSPDGKEQDIEINCMPNQVQSIVDNIFTPIYEI